MQSIDKKMCGKKMECKISFHSPSNQLRTRSQALPGNALSWRLRLPTRASPSLQPTTLGRRSLQCSGFPGRAWEPGGGIE